MRSLWTLLALTSVSIINAAASDPCEHKCSGHGVCEIGGKFGTHFSCNCYRGYSGETCDHAQTACELATSEGRGCQNGTICRDTENPSVIHCDCPNGITEQHCEVVLRSTAEHESPNWTMWISTAICSLIAISIVILVIIAILLGRKVAPSAPHPVENNNVELGGLSPGDEEHVYTKTHDAYPGIYELPRRVPRKRC